MDKEAPTGEPQFSREQVVDALKELRKRGFANPDDLPLEDPEVTAADNLLQMWDDQQRAKVEKLATTEADLEYAVSRSTIYVDAGFDDPGYSDEVANEWLLQDLQIAEEAGLVDLARMIQSKIDEINAKIPS